MGEAAAAGSMVRSVLPAASFAKSWCGLVYLNCVPACCRRAMGIKSALENWAEL